MNIPWAPASDRGQPNGYAEKDADTLAALKQAYDSIPPLDAEKLKQTVNASGYIFLSAAEETVEKKGFLSGLFGK